jgi:hypothetical protein
MSSRNQVFSIVCTVYLKHMVLMQKPDNDSYLKRIMLLNSLKYKLLLCSD